MAKTIPLTQGQFAIVDDEDFEWLNQWKWFAQWNPAVRSFYALRKARGGQRKGKDTRGVILMHRVILGLDTGDKRNGDHIASGQTLDNRRSNLRIATSSENGRNRRNRHTSVSGFKGVTWNADTNKWRAQIREAPTNRHLGLFKDKAEAARAYDRAALARFGEFAFLNFPREEYVNGN